MKLSPHQKKSLVVLLALAAILGGLALVAWIQGTGKLTVGKPASVPTAAISQELQTLGVKKLSSFQDLASYFADLAERKGARYAFEVLRQAPLPPNTDLHLLAHTVGDILYKQEGAGGIQVCTEDFRNACSHAVVIGLFSQRGEDALPEIAAACRHAPGGSGAYTMCFHGLGHGVVTVLGYDFKKAVSTCERTGTPERQRQEFPQCASGALMELISGGAHDRPLWEREAPKTFRVDDPLYPCNAAFLPDPARYLCYLYLTPHLFRAAGGDLGSPTPRDFEQAFRYCDRLPESDGENRDACFGGFGKEFVVLAQDRDIRRIDQMTDEQYLRVYGWCRLAKHEPGVHACINQALQSVYWGGENDRGAAIRFCNAIPEASYQSRCFQNLIGAVRFYIRDGGYRRDFCGELPFVFRAECRERLTQ